MRVGVVSVTLRLYASSSLKEKRFVIQSVKKRLASRFNVAVAEVGAHDQWREAELGVVTVGTDKPSVDHEIEAVTRFLDGDGRFEMVRRDVEYY